ncbi:MAG: AbiV family abortive infection protein [Candidatus Heimdallarchaeota archaeon]|nr:AbiV family abortive infection protein [Candidatus Heimdallarchaeota archaeon]
MSIDNSNIEVMPVKYDFYSKLMKVILDNANQFRKDAQLLREKLSFGHAYSLAILGFEELSKCWFVFGLFLGEYEASDDIVSDITSVHLTKQELGWQIIAMIVMMEWFEETQFQDEIQELFKQLTKGVINLETYTKKYMKFAERESNSSDLAQRVLKLEEVSKKLEADNKYMMKKKNEGFYVDFDLIKRKITSSPDKFILGDIQFIDTFDGFYLYTEELFKAILDNLKRKSIQEALKNTRAMFRRLRNHLVLK